VTIILFVSVTWNFNLFLMLWSAIQMLI